MWNLYQTARTLRCRASELLAIEDAFAAYCLDEAVAWFGTHIESELDKIEGKNARETAFKRETLLKRILGGRPQYADPSESGKVPIERGNV